MRFQAYVLLLCIIPGLTAAQDALPWGSDMNRRLEELTRKEMSWRPTLLVTAEGENWQPVSTVENALTFLCAKDLTLVQEIAINDFLDSAATELWRMGTPVILHTCHHILYPEKLAAEETANGFSYVCVSILCSTGARPQYGIKVFNHRTRLLLNASSPLRPAEVRIGKKHITVGCDTAQTIDRTDVAVLKEWSDHWDSLMVELPKEMLAMGAKKKDVKTVKKEQRKWIKARALHCTSEASGIRESEREATRLSCMEWAGRCRVTEMTNTFHRIVPKMYYRPYY